MTPTPIPLAHRLARSTATGAADTAARQAELARRAAAAGLLDVAVATVDSPLGPLLVAATEAGLVRLAFTAVEDPDAVLARLARAVSPRILTAPARLDDTRRQLDEYFARRRRRFELTVDLQLARGFRARVLDVARDIGYGTTATYRQVAARAGNPAAVRAAGRALGANPVPIVVPCHRVLRSDGALGGYAGGLPAKVALLALERDAA